MLAHFLYLYELILASLTDLINEVIDGLRVWLDRVRCIYPPQVKSSLHILEFSAFVESQTASFSSTIFGLPPLNTCTDNLTSFAYDVQNRDLFFCKNKGYFDQRGLLETHVRSLQALMDFVLTAFGIRFAFKLRLSEFQCHFLDQAGP